MTTRPQPLHRGPSRRPAVRLVTVLLVLVALSLVVPVPGVAKQGSGVHEVVLDRVEPVAAADFAFAPCQDTGRFTALDDGFRFDEAGPGAATTGPGPFPGGYLALGCGEATLARTAPGGARTVQVRFQGDRGVDELDVAGNSITRPGRDFTQQVEFRTGNASADRRVAYMDPAAGSLPLQSVTIDPFVLPKDTAAFTLAWTFTDASFLLGPGLPDVLSGQAFNATVEQVRLEYAGLPAPSAVHDRLVREGRLLVARTDVRVDVTDAGTADLRLVVDGALGFDHLRGPDGRRLATTTTRFAAGPDGFDRTAILVETQDDGDLQVTVPREVLASLGDGEYRLSFSSVDSLRTSPWLLPLVVLVLLAPLPFALVAYRHVRRFEDEAFGGFRRSARNLRIALVVAFLYYAAVVVSHFVGSRFELMTAWPLPFEAILLYVQVAIAVVAFLALFAVARELYNITVPKALPEPRPATPVAHPEDLE